MAQGLPEQSIVILLINEPHVEFEFLTAVVLKSTLVRDVAPCSPFTVNRQAVASNGLLDVISWKIELFNKSSCLWNPTGHHNIHENWIVGQRIKRVLQFMKSGS
jgi:hypothetical protein